MRRFWIFTLSVILLFLIPGCQNNGGDELTSTTEKRATHGLIIKWTYDRDLVDKLPMGYHVLSGKWMVRPVKNAPSAPHALCQVAESEFPSLTLRDPIYTDVEVTAKFKPISGSTDRAAGIIFQVQDNKNYYIFRANALENNVNLYKYVDGKRSLIKSVNAQIKTNQWQSLKVEDVDGHIEGYLNGQFVMEAKDETFTSGKVGLWTKEDSFVCFDDVIVEEE